jgi:penicillin-binding protein 1A
MANDIIMDWINDVQPALGAEGEDMGAGTSDDYEMENLKAEDIKAESEILIEDKKDIKPVTNPATKPAENKPGSTPTNKPGQQPAATPKAVMPPPPKKPGGGNK